MRTPQRPHWLCAAAIAIYASWPAMMATYWMGVLKSGILPPESDTIIIPIINGFAMTVLLSPLFALVLWAALRRHPGRVPIFAKPIGLSGWGWTLFFALAAAWTIAVTITALSFHFSGLLTLHAIFALAVIFQLRGAAVARAYFPVMPAEAGIS